MAETETGEIFKQQIQRERKWGGGEEKERGGVKERKNGNDQRKR